MPHSKNNLVYPGVVLSLLMTLPLLAQAIFSAPEQSADIPAPNAVCERIVRCDQAAAENQTFTADCPAFIQRSRQYPDAAAEMDRCSMDSPCEGFQFQVCLDAYSTALLKGKVARVEHDRIVRGSIGSFLGDLWTWKMPEATSAQMEEFKSHCQTILQCDSDLRDYPDPIETCVNLINGMRERMPLFYPRFQQCLLAPECGAGRLTECMARTGQELLTGEINEAPPGPSEARREGTLPVSGNPTTVIINARMPTYIPDQEFFNLSFVPDHSIQSSGWKFVYVPDTHQWYCLGLRSSDIVRRINNQPVPRENDALLRMREEIATSLKSLTVQRGTQLIQFQYRNDPASEIDCRVEVRPFGL